MKIQVVIKILFILNLLVINILIISWSPIKDSVQMWPYLINRIWSESFMGGGAFKGLPLKSMLFYSKVKKNYLTWIYFSILIALIIVKMYFNLPFKFISIPGLSPSSHLKFKSETCYNTLAATHFVKCTRLICICQQLIAILKVVMHTSTVDSYYGNISMVDIQCSTFISYPITVSTVDIKYTTINNK